MTFKIKLNLIHIPETRIRKDMGSLDSLQLSLQSLGMLEPVMVQATPEDPQFPYELVAGYRRYVAASQLGWEDIPAILHSPADSLRSLDMSIHENMERIGYSPLEISELILLRKHQWEQIHGEGDSSDSAEFYQETATLFRKHPTDIYRFLQLQELDSDLKTQVESGELHYRAALSQQSARKQAQLSQRTKQKSPASPLVLPQLPSILKDLSNLEGDYQKVLMRIMELQSLYEGLPENPLNLSSFQDESLQKFMNITLNLSQWLSELANRFQDELTQRCGGETELTDPGLKEDSPNPSSIEENTQDVNEEIDSLMASWNQVEEPHPEDSGESNPPAQDSG